MLDGLDGHATGAPAIFLTITVADCIPVSLAAPKRGAVAWVQAGWRGAAAGVLRQGIELLKRHAFATGADIVMHCGVGICGDCYEVGAEVAVRFGIESASGTEHLDLRAILARQAPDLGIPTISISPW